MGGYCLSDVEMGSIEMGYVLPHCFRQPYHFARPPHSIQSRNLFMRSLVCALRVLLRHRCHQHFPEG
jgi:hypothetical protein